MKKYTYIKFIMEVPGSDPVDNQIRVTTEWFEKLLTGMKTKEATAKWIVKRYYKGERIELVDIFEKEEQEEKSS